MGAATMTVTVMPSGASTDGRLRWYPATLTFSGTSDTYVTGGFTVDAHAVGLLEILGIQVIAFALSDGSVQTGSWLVQYDNKNGKIQLFTANGTPSTTTALVEAGSATVVSTFVIEIVALGRG